MENLKETGQDDKQDIVSPEVDTGPEIHTPETQTGPEVETGPQVEEGTVMFTVK